MKLKIIQDIPPCCPPWEGSGYHLYHWHNSYRLGEKIDCTDKEGVLETHFESHDADWAYAFPVYLYDHSGTRFSMTPFSCRWDSGQVGWIIIDNGYVDDSIDEANAEEYAKSEINVIDMYSRGDVYGFQVLDDEGEELDSCYGFYVDTLNDEAQERDLQAIHEHLDHGFKFTLQDVKDAFERMYQ